ncbi:MAG TPA: hypothetical protein DIU15_09590 [Deltaproteobacteria bacterium]|nr:hypothetical protein [Deltaproteobacteria bacterium]HCP46283.1 hypothetical protein [Deltaproteobacteria bacterium]
MTWHQRAIPWALSLAVLLVVWAPTQVHAEEDFFEPAALGMGGAVRTLGPDTSAIHLNPASMVTKARYLTSFSYSHYGREKSHLLSTGAYDSKTSNFALGTKYSLRIFEPPFSADRDVPWYPVSSDTEIRDKRRFHRWDVAAAYAFLQRRLNVGLTARVLRKEYEIRENRVRFSMDSGFNVFPLPVLGISVSSQNMIPTNDDRYPTRLAAGLGLMLDPVLQLGVDVVWDFTSSEKPTTDVHGGLEVRILNLFAIRGGYYSDRQFTDNYATWGVGLASDRIKISFSMRIELGPIDHTLREDVSDATNRLWNTIGFEVAFL